MASVRASAAWDSDCGLSVEYCVIGVCTGGLAGGECQWSCGAPTWLHAGPSEQFGWMRSASDRGAPLGPVSLFALLAVVTVRGALQPEQAIVVTFKKCFIRKISA